MELFENLSDLIVSYVPGVLGALIVFILGWLIANGLKRLTFRLMGRTKLDNRLLEKVGSNVGAEKLIAKLVYYIIMIMVLLVVLEMLGVSQVLDPLKNMVNEFMGFLPNLFAAGVIGFAGYFIAKIASELVNITGDFFTKLSAKAGLNSGIDLGSLFKKLVFLIVFIPILIVALDTLKMHSIAEPAKEMLSSFINAIPNIIAAAAIIGIFYIGGRYLTNLLSELLRSLGTDQMADQLKLRSIIGENRSLSRILGQLAFFFILYFGLITGVERLGFTQLTAVLNDLLFLSGKIFFGLVIMIVGNVVSGIAQRSLQQSGDNQFLASIARFAILGLFLAISLRTMGIANEIVNLAFGLTLGSIAVAAALAFGLGGREAGGRQMEYILKRFRKEESTIEREKVS
ncbi:MAG: mechanosensitive ion channel [Bacteroidota bacterium]